MNNYSAFSALILVVVVIILPFAFCESPKGDGFLWAIMITSHACHATACMKPFGMAVAHHDIVYRTMPLAKPATYALVGIYPKAFVCNEIPVKELSEDAAVETWHSSSVYRHTDRTVLCYDIGKFKDNAPCVHLLFRLAEVCVYVHERQTDIRLWHDDRTAGTDSQALDR